MIAMLGRGAPQSHPADPLSVPEELTYSGADCNPKVGVWHAYAHGVLASGIALIDSSTTGQKCGAALLLLLLLYGSISYLRRSRETSVKRPISTAASLFPRLKLNKSSMDLTQRRGSLGDEVLTVTGLRPLQHKLRSASKKWRRRSFALQTQLRPGPGDGLTSLFAQSDGPPGAPDQRRMTCLPVRTSPRSSLLNTKRALSLSEGNVDEVDSDTPLLSSEGEIVYDALMKLEVFGSAQMYQLLLSQRHLAVRACSTRDATFITIVWSQSAVYVHDNCLSPMLLRLCRGAESIEVDSGHELLSQGSPLTDMYFLDEGQLEVHCVLPAPALIDVNASSSTANGNSSDSSDSTAVAATNSSGSSSSSSKKGLLDLLALLLPAEHTADSNDSSNSSSSNSSSSEYLSAVTVTAIGKCKLVRVCNAAQLLSAGGGEEEGRGPLLRMVLTRMNLVTMLCAYMYLGLIHEIRPAPAQSPPLPAHLCEAHSVHPSDGTGVTTSATTGDSATAGEDKRSSSNGESNGKSNGTSNSKKLEQQPAREFVRAVTGWAIGVEPHTLPRIVEPAKAHSLHSRQHSRSPVSSPRAANTVRMAPLQSDSSDSNAAAAAAAVSVQQRQFSQSLHAGGSSGSSSGAAGSSSSSSSSSGVTAQAQLLCLRDGEVLDIADSAAGPCMAVVVQGWLVCHVTKHRRELFQDLEVVGEEEAARRGKHYF
eukprot:10729-Heterococcus_DN1.PRE.1